MILFLLGMWLIDFKLFEMAGRRLQLQNMAGSPVRRLLKDPQAAAFVWMSFCWRIRTNSYVESELNGSKSMAAKGKSFQFHPIQRNHKRSRRRQRSIAKAAPTI